MGKGTMVGVGAGLAAVFISMIMEGGNPAALMAPPALVLILFGTFGAACGGTSLEAAIDALKSVGKAFGATAADEVGLVERITGYAEITRRDGMLALEPLLADEENHLLARGLRLLCDGSTPQDTRRSLIAEAQTTKKVWARRADFFNKMGGYSPTLGIIGTVLGLIHVLEHLGGDPAELGHLIAAAFIATFFGVLFANLVFLPIGAKYKLIGETDFEVNKLVIEAIDQIGSGANPRFVRDHLCAFLEHDQAEELRARAS